MSAVAPFAAVAAPLQRPWIARGAFAGFGPRHVVLCAIVATVVHVVSWAAFLEQTPSSTWLAKLAGQLRWLPVSVVAGILAILCAIGAENLLPRSWHRHARQALALLAAAALGAALSLVVEPFIEPLKPGRYAIVLQMLGMGTWRIAALHFAHSLLLAYVLLALHAVLENSRRASSELHAARIAALRVQRELVESDLHAIQARINPERLCEMLLEIDRAYAEGVASGERRLDELIQNLRAALPSESARAAR